MTNIFLWEAAVGQTNATHAVQQCRHFVKLSGNVIQTVLNKSNENIYHNQSFSFTGST